MNRRLTGLRAANKTLLDYFKRDRVGYRLAVVLIQAVVLLAPVALEAWNRLA